MVLVEEDIGLVTHAMIGEISRPSICAFTMPVELGPAAALRSCSTTESVPSKQALI
jgi:hypothetical protein